MKKVLFILFMLISSLAWSQGFVERHLLSTEITETENSFVYRHYYIPVLDITYHEFSSDSVTWRKDYHDGDCYVRFNNYVSNQTDDSPVYHPEDKWWVFNFCTCNGKIPPDENGEGGGTIDTIYVIVGSDTIVYQDYLKIPFPDSITATTTNYMDSLIHTHAWEAWINDMEDVDAYPANGQVMKWNSARGQWVEGDDLFGIGLLDSTLLDTTVLVIDGGLDYQIINDTTIVFLGLPDTITAATINEVSANSHTHEWEAWLNDMNDVDAYPTDGQVLTWDSITSQWVADDVSGGTGGLVVTEEDGFPYVVDVNQIRFSNTHVTDRGNGVVSVFIGDGADSLTYISAFNDVYRTGKVWVPAGDNRITFSSPLPDSSYVVAGLYTIYGNQVRQNLNYELKDTAGFTALGVMDASWLHYLAIMPDDSLGFDLDLSSVDWWEYFDVSGDSIFVNGVITDNTLLGTGTVSETLGVDTTIIATKTDLDDYVTDVYAVQDSVFPIEHVYYSNNVDTTFVTSIPKPNGIVTGGYVSWIENLDFNVTPSAYYLNGNLYTTSSTDLTLDAADAVNDRIDIIVIDTTETAFVIDGVAAESPQKPTVDPTCQIELTQVLVQAGETVPAGVVSDFVYSENAEWIVSNVGTTTNPASTTSPYRGTYCIDVTSLTNGDIVRFTSDGLPKDITESESVSFAIKLKSNMSFIQFVTAKFYLDGVNISNNYTVTINKSSTSWQVVSIPFSSISLYGTEFDRIDLVFNNWFGPAYSGFYIDYVKMQGGMDIVEFDNSIVLDGDVIANGTTGSTTLTRLATVNEDIGTFGSTTKSVSLTVDGKGRITAITDSTTNYVSLDDSITVFVTPQQLSDSISGFSGGDNWGSQYAVLGSDSLLKGKGTTASPLYADSTLLATQYDLTQLPAGFTDPMTTRGDIIYRDNANATTRLGLGTLNQLLSSDGSDLVWRNDTAFLQWVTAPATKTSAGTAGQMAYSSNYLYICTTTGTEGNAAWNRIAMSTNW